MTTTEKFFEKLFLENDKALPLYTNYDYNKLSNDERTFLSKLTILSKYKSTLKSSLMNPKRIKTTHKKDYIDIYKQCLSYKEMMLYNGAEEEKQNRAFNSVYIFGAIMIGSVGYFMIKKPAGTSLSKEYFYSFLFSSLLIYCYNKWHYYKYAAVVDQVYNDLSNRLNAFPHLKTLNENSDLYSSELADHVDMDEDDDDF
jgi:hypothetical protein